MVSGHFLNQIPEEKDQEQLLLGGPDGYVYMINHEFNVYKYADAGFPISNLSQVDDILCVAGYSPQISFFSHGQLVGKEETLDFVHDMCSGEGKLLGISTSDMINIYVLE